jgi:hypothetical protein
MTTPFKREQRYLILKISDLDKYLRPQQCELLNQIAETINVGRLLEHKPTLNAVVVEDDWPEYEIVWSMLEERCKK